MSKKNERPVTTSTAGFARVSLALILLELITVTSLAGKYFYIRSDDRPDAITHIITVLVQYEHERLEHCWNIAGTAGTLLEHRWKNHHPYLIIQSRNKQF
jgi:hypothetical protein